MTAIPHFTSERAKRRWARRQLNAVRRHGDTCPACASTYVAHVMTTEDGAIIDSCLSCRALWERETRPNPVCKRCEKCAFSPGSPEQQDKAYWQKIVAETVKAGGTFYCHKRTPLRIGDTGFEYLHEIKDGSVTNATECAGWLEARLAYLQKRIPAETA